ncbi:MAG: hypothetical protein IJT04_03955 [Bacteroidales bacterium]|nr:hypothetical protein [Bacteroidales bacterium]
MKKFIYLTILSVLLVFPFKSYSEDSGWQLLGVVNAEYKTGKQKYNESAHRWEPVMESEYVFLYSRFDGNNMAFRIYVPSSGYSYEAKKNPYYLDSSYPPGWWAPMVAGKYFFDPGAVRSVG